MAIPPAPRAPPTLQPRQPPGPRAGRGRRVLRHAHHPGGEAQQHQAGGGTQHARRAGLLADRPRPATRSAAYIGNASAWRSTSIHRPGRGAKRPKAGHRRQHGIRRGQAKPHARNTSMVTAGGAARPAAMATPMNGAVQGVATTHRQQAGEETAEMAPCAPPDPDPCRPGRRQSGTRPDRLRPTANSSHAIAATNTGDWNWNPHPAAAPAARAASSAARQAGKRAPAHRRCRQQPASERRRTALPRQTHRLQRQHRKYAGHQVEYHPAKERQPKHALQPHHRRWRRHDARCRAHRDVRLQPATVAHRQHARHVAIRLKGLAGLQRQGEASPPDGERLRGTISDEAGRSGNEPGIDHRGRRQLGPLTHSVPSWCTTACQGDGRGNSSSDLANSGACGRWSGRPARQIKSEVCLLRARRSPGTPAIRRAP